MAPAIMEIAALGVLYAGQTVPRSFADGSFAQSVRAAGAPARACERRVRRTHGRAPSSGVPRLEQSGVIPLVDALHAREAEHWR